MRKRKSNLFYLRHQILIIGGYRCCECRKSINETNLENRIKQQENKRKENHILQLIIKRIMLKELLVVK